MQNLKRIRNTRGLPFAFPIVSSGWAGQVCFRLRPAIVEKIRRHSGICRTTITSSSASASKNALRDAQQPTSYHGARLTTMGELVASIAHELNQPLMAIVTCGDILRCSGRTTLSRRGAECRDVSSETPPRRRIIGPDWGEEHSRAGLERPPRRRSSTVRVF